MKDNYIFDSFFTFFLYFCKNTMKSAGIRHTIGKIITSNHYTQMKKHFLLLCLSLILSTSITLAQQYKAGEEYAEPNYTVKACSDYKSEPRYGEQWGLKAVRMQELWQVPIINTRRHIIANIILNK